MKKVVVIPNPNNDKDMSVTDALIKKLNKIGITVYIDSAVLPELTGAVRYTDFPEDCELIVVVGGDGSVIDASVYAIERDIPVVGVNLGKVGYLSEVEPDNLDLFDKLVTGDYQIDGKMLLTLKISKDDAVYSTSMSRLAVNDIVISHNSYFGIADFSLEDSVGNSIKYRADGIIFSTPQGSTAYSLSAGGPMIAHDVDSILVTPVCPHSFFNRSVVFNASEHIRIKNTGKPALNISIDGRYTVALMTGDGCVVEKAGKRLKMLTFSRNTMFTNLFKKMKIMEDIK